MNLEDLRAAQTRERATDGLQELRDSFYGDVADYIADLKDRRDAAASAAADPFGDPEVQELTDKIETAEQVVEAIYERRMGKLVKQASLAAAGMPDDPNGLTDEERDLYGDLVERIEANKTHVLDVISGEAEAEFGADVAATRDDGESSETDASSAVGGEGDDASAAAAMGAGLDAEPSSATSGTEDTATPTDDEPAAEAAGDSGGPEPAGTIANDLAEVRGDDGNQDGSEADPDSTADTVDAAADRESDEAAKSNEASKSDDTAKSDGGRDVDRTMVRVTDDVGEIFGLDEREYTLEAEDVVTLPTENAEPLLEKGAAEKLE